MSSSDSPINKPTSEKKAWWVYLLYLMFLPFTLTWFTLKSNWSKKNKAIAIAAIWLVFLIASSANKKTTEVATKKYETAAKLTQAVTPEPTLTLPTDKPLTLQDKLWKAIDDKFRSRDGYNVSFDAETKTARLTYSNSTFFDETSLVRGAYTSLVKYGTEVFKIDGVESLTVQYKTEFTDYYGKKNMDTAVRVTMTKSEFKKFDWEGYKYKSAYPVMVLSAEENYIHPAILKSMDKSKMYIGL